MSDDRLDLLCAILREEPVVWSAVLGRGAGIFDTARHHGVHLLLIDRLRQQGVLDTLPEELRARLKTGLRDGMVVEQLVRQELREAIAALDGKGVRPLLFKGGALAFSHYPDPALRPHVDVDLLVNPAEVQATIDVLEGLGFQRPPFVTGTLITYQVTYWKTDRYGVKHAFDIHWKTTNPQVFAHLLSIEELAARAVPVPPLGRTARAVGPVDALVLACIHRVAHHQHEDRLIWLHDIHLLAGRLDAAEIEEFLCLARAKRIMTVCAQGVRLARARFGTVLPKGFLDRLSGSETKDERSAAYLRGDMSRVEILLSDLRALKTWSERLRLLQEHVFPPALYMERVYGVSHRGLLPAYYTKRFVEGARDWFRRAEPKT